MNTKLEVIQGGQNNTEFKGVDKDKFIDFLVSNKLGTNRVEAFKYLYQEMRK